MCNGVVHVDDVPFLFAGSSSFLQNQEYVSSWSQLHCFSTLPASAAQERFTFKLRDINTRQLFCVTPVLCVLPFFSLHTHTLPCPVTLLSVLPLSAYISFSVPPAPFLTITIPLSLPICPICLTLPCHKKSQRLLLLCSLVSPFFRFSCLPFIASLAVPLKPQFLCVSSSLVLSVSGYYYMYTHFTSKHCYPIPLNSSYSVSLCYFLGRSMCPGAVFQRCQ